MFPLAINSFVLLQLLIHMDSLLIHTISLNLDHLCHYSTLLLVSNNHVLALALARVKASLAPCPHQAWPACRSVWTTPARASLGADASAAGLVRPRHPLTGRKRLAPFPRSGDDPFNMYSIIYGINSSDYLQV